MLDKPQIVQTTEQPAAIIRLTVPRSEIQNGMEPSLRELMAAIAAQGIAPAGPWFTHHLLWTRKSSTSSSAYRSPHRYPPRVG